MSIDWTRATKVERETITNALHHYKRRLEWQQSSHDNRAVRSNAAWRQHVVETLLDDLDPR